ncbi:MAG TPA: Dabb family protein [Pseudolysinimonas sp.]|nr:Dabb family protein [Pseudolysinimonas sp.]
MIRHIVTWKLSADDALQRSADAAGIKTGLENLVGIIDGMPRLEVGIDIATNTSNWDVVLVSEFDDEAALAGYQVHPDHVAVAQWVKTVVSERSCVDYTW